MLKPLTAEDARSHGAWFLKVETERFQYWATVNPVLRSYAVHASTRDEICSAALDEYNPNAKYTTFIWVGPVPDAEAAALCENLNKPADEDKYDCVLLRTVR